MKLVDLDEAIESLTMALMPSVFNSVTTVFIDVYQIYGFDKSLLPELREHFAAAGAWTITYCQRKNGFDQLRFERK
jgi:hypothetical protein